MSHLSTTKALDDVLRLAFTSFVSDLVALETHLCLTVHTFVLIGATQYACKAMPFVGALSHHVAKLLTSAALNRRISLKVVATRLLLQFAKHVLSVFTITRLIIAFNLLRNGHFIVKGVIILLSANQFALVAVALYGTTWYYQIGVPIGATTASCRHDVIV